MIRSSQIFTIQQISGHYVPRCYRVYILMVWLALMPYNEAGFFIYGAVLTMFEQAQHRDKALPQSEKGFVIEYINR